jgi:hypothetical protein
MHFRTLSRMSLTAPTGGVNHIKNAGAPLLRIALGRECYLQRGLWVDIPSVTNNVKRTCAIELHPPLGVGTGGRSPAN